MTMRQKLRETLETTWRQLTEATEGYDWDEQAEFFGELADRCYGRQEILSASPDVEMQNYEED